MKGGQTLAGVLFWRRVIPHENLVGKTILTECVCLKTITLILVCDTLFVPMLPLKTPCRLINRKRHTKQPYFRKEKVHPH